MAEQHWRVQESSYRMPRDHKPVVLYYDPTPGGRKNDDGTTTISLNFPALVLTEWVNVPEEIGKRIAAELNAFGAMDKLLAEAADYLNTHSGMDGMDLGNKITQFRLALQKQTGADVGGSRE